MVAAASAMAASMTTLPMAAPSAAASSGAGQVLNQNDFLTLMTAQLKNQDPLNPMTGAEFAAELAQFSTAQGVQTLQTGLTGVGNAVSGIEATGLVGHKVAVPGNSLVLASGAAATGAVTLSAAATDVTVKIADSSGKTVATLDLGPMAAGTQSFSWSGAAGSGQAPAGTYTFSVNAAGSNGAAVTATPCAVVPVTAVALGGQSGPMLDLGGGFAPVALSAVQQVF